MPNLIILVGIPGCGKSTWARELFNLHYKIVSSDRIREQVLGDVNDQTRNDEVFQRFHQEIDHGLRHNVDVIADSTALDQRARHTLQGIADYHHADVHLVLFKNNIQALMQNKLRDRIVPPEAMNKMLVKYERALLDIDQENFVGRYKSLTTIGRVG